MKYLHPYFYLKLIIVPLHFESVVLSPSMFIRDRICFMCIKPPHVNLQDIIWWTCCCGHTEIRRMGNITTLMCSIHLPFKCFQSHEGITSGCESLFIFINSSSELNWKIRLTYWLSYWWHMILQSLLVWHLLALSSWHKSIHLCNRIHHHCFSCCLWGPGYTSQVLWHPFDISQSSPSEEEFDLKKMWS